MSAREVRVDLAALLAMHEDARSCPVETGGICLGPDGRTISEYVPSGPDARRTASSYALDVAYLQPRLAAAEDRGLRFVGVHHVHPEGCAQLSGVDGRAAASILKDPNWNVSTLLLPLTVRVRGGVQTTVFVAEGPKAAIAEARLVVGSDFSAGAGRKDGATKDEEREPLMGPARLDRELDVLRARGYDARAGRRGGRGTEVRVTGRGARLVLLLPPEFPLSPPDVSFEREGRRVPLRPGSLRSLLGWSSLRTLAEVAGEASERVAVGELRPSLLLRRVLDRARMSLAVLTEAG